MHDHLIQVGVALALGLAACVPRSTGPVAEFESAARGEQDDSVLADGDLTPELKSSDPLADLAELMSLQPQLPPVELPVEFHLPPAPPPPMVELHRAKPASHAVELPPFLLDRFNAMPSFRQLPDKAGACEVRRESPDGNLQYLNHTNWHDGLPVASFVDTDGDSQIDEHLYYTHDAHRRLIRVVEDHPEFFPACIWRKDTVEIGYDAYGGLARVDVESVRALTIDVELQTRTYDNDGRIQSVFDFRTDSGQVNTASFFTWSAGRVERVDTFTRSGRWDVTSLVTVRGAFTRIDWFQPGRGDEPTWFAAKIYEETDGGPRLRVELTASPQGPVLEYESKIENDLEIGLAYSLEKGQVFSRIITAPDGSWFIEEARADDTWKRVAEAVWDEFQETLVQTYESGSRRIYKFNCPTFTPPKVMKRERCTKLPEPIYGPHDSDY